MGKRVSSRALDVRVEESISQRSGNLVVPKEKELKSNENILQASWDVYLSPRMTDSDG